MYTDVNGNLIAQYYDPAIDDFVPFAEQSAVRILDKDGNPISSDNGLPVQLTGRNVELIARALDQDVSAGAKRYVLGFYNPTQLHEFRYIFTHVASGLDTGHDFDVGITYDAIEYTSGFSGSLVYEEFKEEFSKLRSTVYLKRHIPVLGDVLRIRIFNNDTVDHSYDVHLWGVK